jgi:hypothetical protein
MVGIRLGEVRSERDGGGAGLRRRHSRKERLTDWRAAKPAAYTMQTKNHSSSRGIRVVKTGRILWGMKSGQLAAIQNVDLDESSKTKTPITRRYGKAPRQFGQVHEMTPIMQLRSCLFRTREQLLRPSFLPYSPLSAPFLHDLSLLHLSSGLRRTSAV